MWYKKWLEQGIWIDKPEEKITIEKCEDDINELNLSKRSYNALKRVGIEKISQIAELFNGDKKELLKIKGFGITSQNEVKEKLEAYKDKLI